MNHKTTNGSKWPRSTPPRINSTTLPTAGPTPGKNTLTGSGAESLMMGVFDQRPERFNPRIKS